MKSISKHLEVNIAEITELFKNNFTFHIRRISSPLPDGNTVAICYIEGMVNLKWINEDIIEPLLFSCKKEQLTSDRLVKDFLSSGGVTTETDFQKSVDAVNYGDTVIFIDNDSTAVIVSTKGFTMKAINEPPGETITKGPHEGFTENTITNLSLLRRRLPVTTFKCEECIMGSKTNTKVTVCYIDGIVKKKTLAMVIERLEKLDYDEILDSNQINELIRDHRYSPFKTIGSTERPDVVASKLLEGRVAILVEGSPVVLTAPYLFIEYFLSNADYYINFFYGSVGRILRILSFFLTISLPSVYIALTNYHQGEIPVTFFMNLAAERDGVPISNVVEMAIMLVGFELLREASDRVPVSIGLSLSIVGSLIIGQVAVTARLVSAPVVFVVALTATTGLLINNIKGAVIVIRMLLLLLSSVMGLFGLLMGLMLLTVYLFSMKSFGTNYMSYLLPIGGRRSPDVPFRLPYNLMKRRPFFANKRDKRGHIK